MREELLQYIWQFQHFNLREISTTEGAPVQIISPGIKNFDAGPDFSAARIRIGETLWAGNVEIHFRSSDWTRHRHTGDPRYENVILHVVWEHDNNLIMSSGQAIPTLELSSRVPKVLLTRYQNLMQATGFIPCAGHVWELSELEWVSWRERLATERLQARAENVLDIFAKTNHSWEETFWIQIARTFGLTANTAFFEDLARRTPLKILARHKHSVLQLESILLGQAGLLDDVYQDKYPEMLKKEYLFFKAKYKLEAPVGQPAFLRMRPANFPTIRLAQLAILIHQSEHLFSRVRLAAELIDVIDMLSVSPNDYWLYHYRFEEKSAFRQKKLGRQMINNILINTVIPALCAYSIYYNDSIYLDKALRWLEELPPEKNTITKNFEKLNFPNQHAAASQALLHLKKMYCEKKLCLHCAVGNKILKNKAGSNS